MRILIGESVILRRFSEQFGFQSTYILLQVYLKPPTACGYLRFIYMLI
jgi:hypothetical protein